MITVNRFTLSNGLRVVHNHDSATAMVALDILYNVGSRDERPERTGMAHLFEHLMFGGSENVAEFDKALENAGGTNNAWTNSDYTNFYDIVPAHNAETAFWLESDRMKGLAFSDKALEVQRQVVCEEFKQVCLNQPYGDLQHYLNGLAYKEHPYRIPVIGKELSHIENVTQDEVRRFFYDHYAPNNAVISV
ncbi:pitrilysin family protein, partial [uncultured Muribaculum sp.]